MSVDPAHVERMAAALTSAGLSRPASLVFAALTVDEDGRMTSAELRERLGVSAGTVSGAVAFLERVHFIRRERDRGTRRDVYVVSDDAWHEAMRPDQAYAPIVAALDDTLAALPAGSPARRRLVLMREFLTFVTAEMHRMQPRWEQRRREIERELDA